MKGKRRNRSIQVIMILFFVIMTAACRPGQSKETLSPVHVSAEDKQLGQTEKNGGSEDQPVITGMVLPHHQLAQDMIEYAWQVALEDHPDLIVLMGPDHPGLADHPLIWTEETECRLAWPCAEEAQAWIEKGLGGEALVADHSIETPLTFLPERARDIPVLALTVPRGMEDDLVDKIVESINELKDQALVSGHRLLLVGSVDFSHGLASDESKIKDGESFAWIQARDYAMIGHAGNAYFDSPETIEIFLRCLSGPIDQVKRSDSSDFARAKDVPGTSYQVIQVKD